MAVEQKCTFSGKGKATVSDKYRMNVTVTITQAGGEGNSSNFVVTASVVHNVTFYSYRSLSEAMAGILGAASEVAEQDAP